MSPATSRSLRRRGPPQLADWLGDRGLEPGWGWMSFRRDVEPVARRSTSLRLVRVGAAEAQDFGRIVATGYGLPDAVVPWAAQAPNLGWECWLALDGDEPAAAAGAVHRRGRRVPRLRGHPARASGQGSPERACSRSGSTTRARRGVTSSSPRPASAATACPSNSYRNILRAGFTEVAVRANWLRPAPQRAQA